MIDSIFRVAYSLLFPTNPAKEIVEQYRMREEGQKAMRNARTELWKLQQKRPIMLGIQGLHFPCPRHPERIEYWCTICYPLTEEEKAINRQREIRKSDDKLSRAWAGKSSFNKPHKQ